VAVPNEMRYIIKKAEIPKTKKHRLCFASKIAMSNFDK